jgi:DNA repair exonuclease SbcCD ATPase subunit
LDESFKETIKSRHRDDFTYNNFSEGEKLRIDMALMLTWREVAKIKNSAHTNILILDEIFDSSLDDAGIDFLLSILHSIETINIFVISHKGELVHDRFDNVIRFQRVKNFSKKK